MILLQLYFFKISYTLCIVFKRCLSLLVFQDVLGVVQNLGLFSDVFYHGMRYLQVQYEVQRTGEAAGGTVTQTSDSGKQVRND